MKKKYPVPSILLIFTAPALPLALSNEDIPEVNRSSSKASTTCDALVREEHGEWDVWDESYYNE